MEGREERKGKQKGRGEGKGTKISMGCLLKAIQQGWSLLLRHVP